MSDVRKQAAELRFILEAPEMEIGADERVTIPVGQEFDSFADKWSRNAPARKKIKLSWEEEWAQNYKPSVWIPDKTLLAIISVLSLGVAIYSAMHIRTH